MKHHGLKCNERSKQTSCKFSLKELDQNLNILDSPDQPKETEKTLLKSDKQQLFDENFCFPYPGSKQSDLIHGLECPSIIQNNSSQSYTPWTPKSLGRAKSAIVYKHTLNDTLFVRERSGFIFHKWVPYFFSLQKESILLFDNRDSWEQGCDPKRVIRLNRMQYLSEMTVEVVESSNGDSNGYDVERIFRRKLLETNSFDSWLNSELNQKVRLRKGSVSEATIINNTDASATVILEFSCNVQSTFELWSKAIKKILSRKNEKFLKETPLSPSRYSIPRSPTHSSGALSPDCGSKSGSWVTPGHDCRISLLQSEVWCNRVAAEDSSKAESELRRIHAMEQLMVQITSDDMALLVYEKVSKVHEMFYANSRREILSKSIKFGGDTKDDGCEGSPMSDEVLNFFVDHLKRKYSVFLNLALAFKLPEEDIREAHERMCRENNAENGGSVAGSGQGTAENPIASTSADSFGFDNTESKELYLKYRPAAQLYFQQNFGDPSSAEEEDAIMHLPVTLHIALLQDNEEDANSLYSILCSVKERLKNLCNDRLTSKD